MFQCKSPHKKLHGIKFDTYFSFDSHLPHFYMNASQRSHALARIVKHFEQVRGDA